MNATIIANSQDLGRACSVDLYQTYTADYIEDSEGIEYDMDAVVKDMAMAVAVELPHYCKAITSVQVLETGSPKYYNYSTDWADYKIWYDSAEVSRWCRAHKAEWEEWYQGWKSSIECLDEESAERSYRWCLARLGCYINHQPDIECMIDGLYGTMFEAYANNVV